MGLFDRFFQSPGNDRRRPEDDPEYVFSFEYAATRAKYPFLHMLGAKSQFAYNGLRSMHLGSAAGQWMLSGHEGHALILAPARSAAGKTSGVIVPNLLSMVGPVVVTSTKDDVVRASALFRGRYGRLWSYAPDGDTAIPPGVKSYDSKLWMRDLTEGAAYLSE